MSDMNVSDHIKTQHNRMLHEANQELARQVNELVEYQIENPELKSSTNNADVEKEKAVKREIENRKKAIRAQLAVIKSLYRQSVIRVREEKAQTSDSRNVNDTLILQLHNLKYEEQSLSSEISAAQNYDHKYMKLPLISVEEFLELFPDHQESSEHDIMTARIEHEYQVRMKLEERRQEKLKQKQMLIAEVKKRKDDLTKLDGMLERFIEAAAPIQKVLATE
ncbi:hypothetical protein BU24DRAFT_462091 [Aaosphaeria arxii CBS 175.79]|uniref:Fms interacting protein n=1 Tax=Aaosphaeria arxii CBS 175.79 TaxID=1450172 RepID=A0A6A5XT65_9PLEO|nr:uncharacterized protein BU24DRAFT_462091 [Aaosphaeria arxii CBS 175.79]KAF2015870.1 hypothetical protein BU24DRAFT_462091 [Aaosphaeria arxii CBS 175.79]